MNPRLEILNKVTNPNRDKRGMEQLSLSESSILSSSSSSKWRIPQKGIFSEQDVQKFRESNAKRAMDGSTQRLQGINYSVTSDEVGSWCDDPENTEKMTGK